jgi:hypothetical protein
MRYNWASGGSAMRKALVLSAVLAVSFGVLYSVTAEAG